MAYDVNVSVPGLIAQKNGSLGAAVWVYKSGDSSDLVGDADYFSNGSALGMKVGDQVIVIDTTTNATTVHTVSGVTSGGAASLSGGTQVLLVSGAVSPGMQIVELNDLSTPVEATIANAATHAGLFIVKDTDASGTIAHTLTLTLGTFDGTNTVATLNAPGETLVVFFDGAGNGTIIENTGAVALS